VRCCLTTIGLRKLEFEMVAGMATVRVLPYWIQISAVYFIW